MLVLRDSTSNAARRVVGLVLCLLVTVALPAHAQDQNAAAAEALFRDGRAAAEAGDYQTACAKFHESNRLDPAVGTVFNIADCEEKLGHVATAWTSFQEVAQRLPVDDERRAIAVSRSAALEPRLPRLRIHLLPAAPAGSSVRRDGVTLGTASLDTALPVDPGRHQVEVTAPGRPSRSYETSVPEGETKVLEVSAGEAPREKRVTALVTPERSSPKTLGYVLGGVGLGAAVAGVVTGILVLDRKDTVDKNCNADKRCNQAGLDAARSGKTLGVVTTVALATGAVGLGAGTYLVLSAGRGQKTETAAAIALRGSF
jgi:hypothetical protein